MDSLEEELLVVEAIFPECISRDPRSPSQIHVRPHADQGSNSTSITLLIPEDYPETVPIIHGVTGMTHSQVQEALDVSWTPGEVCLYAFIDKLREQADGIDLPKALHGNTSPLSLEDITIPNILSSDSEDDRDFNFAVSEQVVDRKSSFVGRAIEVHSRAEAQAALRWLKHDKKIAKATHNIVAWRIVENDILMQDNDDDGEDAAGGRLAHLLEIIDIKNVMVVVSRWYGGIQLHGDRFKHISNVGREALQIGGFLPEQGTPSGKGGSKKKAKKRIK